LPIFFRSIKSEKKYSNLKNTVTHFSSCGENAFRHFEIDFRSRKT